MTTANTPGSSACRLWQDLVDHHPDLIRQAEQIDRTSVSAIARLRKHASPELAHRAAQLAEARQRARAKLGDRAAELIADIQGVEQASHLAIATIKAERFQQAGFTEAMDLCSGIGVDAMALSDSGIETLAVDLDPLRAWMTSCNANCSATAGDAGSVDVSRCAVHLDPARRSEGQRSKSLTDYLPDAAAMAAILGKAPAACIKLSPAVDLAEAEDYLTPACQQRSIEFVSLYGRLVQALWWTQSLAQPATDSGETPRAALRIDDAGIHRLVAEPEWPDIGPVPEQGVLHTLDPAAERANLATHLCSLHGGTMPHPRAGLIAAAEPIDSPWLTSFRVEAELPWRQDKVHAWLKQHRTGLVEIKPRGLTLDTDQLQKTLRGPKKQTPRTLFITRIESKVRCWITQRLSRT
ncbi:THUMP-like domain-containing protein [Mucisphaera sp.]|uniref:THUMP-like domain-containing protein n=1 Tax=Mucisphaera sp. TaxID=2913024 RepID=UPI003D0DB26B